jgi:hypothetical protein
MVQRHGAGGAVGVEAGPLGLASGGGRPLPEAVCGKMEAALGANFSDVRVYVGPQAERIGAIAFTIGSDIYFAPGRYQPDTPHGQQLLGHELAHVVQQRAGRVRNPLGSGLAVVQDHALEAEADRLGQRAATYRVEVQAKLMPGAGQVRISTAISAEPGSYRLTADARGRQFGSVMVHARDRASIQAKMAPPHTTSPSGPARVMATRALGPVIQRKGWTWNGHTWVPDFGANMPQPGFAGGAVGARLVTFDPPTVDDVVADCSDNPLSIADYNRGRDYASATFGFAGHRAHSSNRVHLHPRSRLREMADAGATVAQLQEVVRLWGI